MICTRIIISIKYLEPTLHFNPLQVCKVKFLLFTEDIHACLIPRRTLSQRRHVERKPGRKTFKKLLRAEANRRVGCLICNQQKDCASVRTSLATVLARAHQHFNSLLFLACTSGYKSKKGEKPQVKKPSRFSEKADILPFTKS